MVKVQRRSEAVRNFIIANVTEHMRDIVAVTAARFGLTRQAVNKHIHKLIAQQLISAQGNTRNREYRLCPGKTATLTFDLKGLQEDVVWREVSESRLRDLPDNVLDIWNYGFTEMLNNAIDHSQGSLATITIEKNPAFVDVRITDNGVGIFRRIQKIMGLRDERHAVLELAKGKLTTDPRNHTGEGIFFSSRMFDKYVILSGGVHFSHEFNKPEDWILETQNPQDGTTIFMRLANNSARTSKSIFDKFASSSEYGFDKTVVPVSLARYGNELLVSRSQAKRLLTRVDRFRIVIFDFSGINQIGQAFADEVFRVFKSQHPEMELYFTKAEQAVEDMIIRALGRD